MKTVVHILVIALISVLIVLAVFCCIFVETLNRATADMPIVLDKAIAREGLETRKTLTAAINRTEKDLDKQIAVLNGTIKEIGKDVATKADAQVAALRTDLDGQMTALTTVLDRRIGEVTVPAGDTILLAQDLLPPVQNIVAVASDNATILGDCDHNPNCLANRIIGVMKSTEKMAQAGEKMATAIAKETPETAAAVKNTSRDMSVIVSRFARPVSWAKGVAGTAITWAGKFFGF